MRMSVFFCHLFDGESDLRVILSCKFFVLRILKTLFFCLPAFSEKSKIYLISCHLEDFRERGREGKREGEKYWMCERNISWLSLSRPKLRTWPKTQACALTGNRTSNPLVHRPVLSPLSHTRQSMVCNFVVF